MSIETNLMRAAEAISRADAFLIGAGAGMGVDSGLPDFRSPQGFWKAYPVFQGKQFSDISNPIWFKRDPEQAWGFFGHRMNLYRGTKPHAGFAILKRWVEGKSQSSFVFTSNVDGHFQEAGFAELQVLECHGSIHYLQCCLGCTDDIWPIENLRVDVDPETIRAASPLPQCKYCDSLARPNILMFGDYGWNQSRCDVQSRYYYQWLKDVEKLNVVALEFGAGTAIPTVRYECETQADTLIRINPRDPDGPENCISLALPALEALNKLDALFTTEG